ncbi:MAG: hypothetical protein FJ398_00290 [Verrucomicrobia bacterium]|nr:hypothetical protein [Verrucomicrobiota bacterium]
MRPNNSESAQFGERRIFSRIGRRPLRFALGLCVLLHSLAASLRAELQFDIFVGYDSVVREASWFPIACEVFNDGPTFNAYLELSAANLRADQVRRVAMELPTNTRKRFVIPMFASGGRFSQWSARLVDDRGRVQAERPNLQPRILAWEGILMGSLSRSFAGMPALPESRQNRPELKPQVARMLVEQFPDSPIALEGLDVFYLNSEKALELKVNQVSALLAWVRGGGHLIVGVEQLADVNSTPWLQQLLPCDLKDLVNVTVDASLQQWLQSGDSGEAVLRASVISSRRRGNFGGQNSYATLAADPAFAQAQAAVAIGSLRDGRMVLEAQGRPLIIDAKRGRGQVTVLTFSPEREPFRSWKNRPWFWSKLIGVPSDWYTAPDISAYGGFSLDGVFGALIDSRQVRKLPVQWLLLLLVVYLIVIGPFDQYWLKKIGRQMLTWVTFPTYVVLFSLLIYFIGYKLRAGETEWNELHVVDILPRGANRADLRGRTYASVYSSSNARYPVAFTPAAPDVADQTHATLRGEVLDLYGSGRESSRATIEQHGNTFRAEVFVPVWTSLLYVNDWLQPGTPPLLASISTQGATWDVSVQNMLDHPLTDARIVVRSLVFELSTLPPGEKKEFKLEPSKGMALQNFVLQHGGRFQEAINARRSSFGDNQRGQLENPALNASVASFYSYLQPHPQQRNFVAPPGLDLTPLIQRGDAVLLAFDPNHTFTNPINGFKPPRSQRSTLLRLAITPDTAPRG